MATQLIQPQRIRRLAERENGESDYVLYWMEQSQRAQDNHAVEYAVRAANERGQPLMVLFVIPENDPELSLRQATFLLEGIEQTQTAIQGRGIKMVVRCGEPDEVTLDVAKRASMVICDRGYLRQQKSWRRSVAENASCSVVEVESDVVVPVDVVSDKREYAARTIRPKLNSHLPDYLLPLTTTPMKKDSTTLPVSGDDLTDREAVLRKIKVDRSVPAVSRWFRGGTSQATAKLNRFVESRLTSYDDHRSDPVRDAVSHMSMYLHFGQISPLTIALKIKETSAGTQTDRESYMEELIIRRELSKNFVNFTPDYDSYSCLPDWAAETLDDHRHDQREKHYTLSELENGETHDEYWNAAMREMRETGYMHNHMRMYWGKQILAWTNTPDYAYRITEQLNNRYFLDGRDPNSFANVAWLFGNHDRAFGERDVFGKVRTMTTEGLSRKCNPDAYVDRVNDKVDED